MQRAAWARWRSRVYFLAVFRIALSKFHPIFAQIGHLPQNLQQTYEIPVNGTHPLSPPRAAWDSRQEDPIPHPQVPNPLSCTEVTMGPKNTGRGIESEDRGPMKEDPCRTPRVVRPSWARGRRVAGVTARRLVTKVKTPFFNDLEGFASLCIRPHFAFVIIVLQRAACRVPSCGAKCKT